MLSVGGANGVAHLGAIEALKQSGIKVDCVVGTSFGALAGSMYGSAPGENAPERFSRFMREYVEQTERDKAGGAIVGLLLFGGDWFGPLVGAGAVNELDQKRFVSVLDHFYRGAAIETLPVSFATLHQERVDTGFRMVTVSSGDLAKAVGDSAANPFIFQDLNPRTDRVLDPGLDRVAAVPVEEACKLYPGARLVAVNVTETPAFYSSSMNCPLLEVRVKTAPADPTALVQGPVFDALVTAGFNATRKALARSAAETASARISNDW